MVLQLVLNRILEPPSKRIPAMLTDKRLDLAWPGAMSPYVSAQNDAEFMEWLSSDWLEVVGDIDPVFVGVRTTGLVHFGASVARHSTLR